MTWDSVTIRKTFLDFFEKKQHQIVPSAPMVVKDDPTLMFINAGMNQFKDYFLGNSKPSSPRITDTQKCLRVSGKHNDLEEVGVDTYHHTMFEMLGNWSFGDYFKEEAIAWSWELLTEVYGIDKDRLYVTYFGGDAGDNLPEDAEAKQLWARHIDANRIIAFDKKDNFWEMGDTGPCGPCAEIHVDIRSDEERQKTPGKDLVNQDHPQVIEIWNLVFIEFNRMASGQLVKLPAQHVDTGMGFERLAVVLQGKNSNYDTDIFTPLIQKVESLSNKKYTRTDSKQDIAMRVISDHVRAISFSIADGQLPSNTGAGYVIRRILRRAIRYGYSFLDFKEPFVFELVETLKNQMGHAFPELNSQFELIQKVIREEEESFLRTLERGIQKFNEYKEHHKQVKGDFAFELYDTFGFPIDLTQLMAAENNMMVDIKGFEAALNEQKERSRKATNISTDDWVILREDDQEEFIGYDYTSTDVMITRYRKVNQKGKEFYQLAFNVTPFYAEGGGQVGDTGFIEGDQSGKVEIFDTKKENNLILHFATEIASVPHEKFKAVVDLDKRQSTANNHSATHLLHQALREVLGTHVEQKGSLVNANHLRFDFSHFQKVTPEEIREIETIVNNRIRSNYPLEENRSVPMDEAKEMGAMALFGEKYGDVVRVIKFGDSVELCGGTHVKRTGDIGVFKIVSEGSVAAGIRRIEAHTASTALNDYIQYEDQLNELKSLLKNTKNIQKSIEDLLAENEQLQSRVKSLKQYEINNWKEKLLQHKTVVNGIDFIALEVDLDNNDLKDLLFQLKGDLTNLVVVTGIKGEKAILSIAASNDVVNDKGFHAGNAIREAAKEIQGGGGGQPFYATAGGKNPNGLPGAFNKVKEIVEGL